MKSAVDVGTFGYPSTASPRVFERVIFPYGLAVLSVAVALGIKLILLHFNFPYPLSTSFLLAIAITFWYAGTGPGILSVLLSFIAFALLSSLIRLTIEYVLPDGSTKPVYVSGVTASHIQYFFYFALLALLMSWFSSSRRRAEQSLSQARRELETKVEERTAKLSRANEELQTEIIERKSAEEKLRRSEAFLTEGQRISHTGSWSWNVSSGKVAWSEEHFRIFGFDPEKTQPSYQLFLETVHPEDRSTIEQKSRREQFAKRAALTWNFESRLRTDLLSMSRGGTTRPRRIWRSRSLHRDHGRHQRAQARRGVVRR